MTNKSYAITMSLLRIGVLAAQIAVSPSAAAQWRDFLVSSLSISRQETERTEQIIQLGFCRVEGIALLPDNR